MSKQKLADQELAAVPIEKRVNNLNKEVNQSNSGKLEAVFNSKMKLQKDKLLTTHSIRMHQVCDAQKSSFIIYLNYKVIACD